jgi:ABC-type enterobactin transport system permease subunit
MMMMMLMMMMVMMMVMATMVMNVCPSQNDAIHRLSIKKHTKKQRLLDARLLSLMMTQYMRRAVRRSGKQFKPPPELVAVSSDAVGLSASAVATCNATAVLSASPSRAFQWV